MKKTQKAILCSIVTLALCISLVSGATFALFTSEDSVSVAVTSGKVSVSATVEDVMGYSAYWNGTAYEDREADNATKTFANGGTFALDSSSAVPGLQLVNMTPGDVVKFAFKISNSSNVATKYRFKLVGDGSVKFMSALKFSINGTEYEGILSYASAWASWTEPDDLSVPVEIRLPIECKDDCQELSCTIKLSVEAIQGNGNVSGEEEIEYYDPAAYYVADGDALLAGLGEAESVVGLESDVQLNGTGTYVGTSKFKLSDGGTLNLREHTLRIESSKGYDGLTLKSLDNVVIENGTISVSACNGYEGALIINSSNVTLRNVTIDVGDNLTTSSATSMCKAPLALYMNRSDLTLENCTFNGAVQISGGSNDTNLVARNCIFNGPLGVQEGAAVLYNSTFSGANDASNNWGNGATLVAVNCNITDLDIHNNESYTVIIGGTFSGNITCTKDSSTRLLDFNTDRLFQNGKILEDIKLDEGIDVNNSRTKMLGDISVTAVNGGPLSAIFNNCDIMGTLTVGEGVTKTFGNCFDAQGNAFNG